MANQPSVLSVSAQRRLGRELFGGWEVDRNLRHAVQIVRDRLVADDHDRVDEIGFCPTGREESVRRRLRHVAALLCDGSSESGQRVKLGVERGLTTTDLNDLSLSETDHLAERRVS